MIDLTENLRMVELYCETQGDKFHPMSDEVLETLRSTVNLNDKAANVESLCEKFSTVHAYHVGRILNKLTYDEDEGF